MSLSEGRVSVQMSDAGTLHVRRFLFWCAKCPEKSKNQSDSPILSVEVQTYLSSSNRVAQCAVWPSLRSTWTQDSRAKCARLCGQFPVYQEKYSGFLPTRRRHSLRNYDVISNRCHEIPCVKEQGIYLDD